MSEEPMRYGAGGVPYKPKGVPVPEPAVAEEIILEPTITVSVTEDDRPLTDEQVVRKVTGRKTK